jgi:FKBP-type peptidyl-prolyl cis-trans isomerase FklB
MKPVIIVTVLLSLLSVPLRAEDKPAEQKPAEKTDVSAASTNVTATGTNAVITDTNLLAHLNTNKIALTNLNMKAAYIMGLQNASTMLMSGGEMLDAEIICMGIRDVFYKKQPMLSQDEAEDVMKKFEKAYQEFEAEKVKKEAEFNKTNGIAFLEENKKKPGIITTPSGLQYEILTEGKGEPPTENDKVAIHFRSKITQGIEFANSYKHKEPVPVYVKGQIKGWREALVMMKPGAKWRLFVPSELAYGTREVGKGVGPNSTLIFELELVSVLKDDDKADKPAGKPEAKK